MPRKKGDNIYKFIRQRKVEISVAENDCAECLAPHRIKQWGQAEANARFVERLLRLRDRTAEMTRTIDCLLGRASLDCSADVEIE